MTNEEIIQAFKAIRIWLNSNQWTVDSGTETTPWNCCVECGEDDFRGHKRACIIPPMLNNLDNAIIEIEKRLK